MEADAQAAGVPGVACVREWRIGVLIQGWHVPARRTVCVGRRRALHRGTRP